MGIARPIRMGGHYISQKGLVDKIGVLNPKHRDHGSPRSNRGDEHTVQLVGATSTATRHSTTCRRHSQPDKSAGMQSDQGYYTVWQQSNVHGENGKKEKKTGKQSRREGTQRGPSILLRTISLNVQDPLSLSLLPRPRLPHLHNPPPYLLPPLHPKLNPILTCLRQRVHSGHMALVGQRRGIE